MDMDELIDGLIDTSGESSKTSPVIAATPSSESSPDIQNHRERIAALVAGGQAEQYLGKALTTDQIDAMDNKEIERLYARYEAKLGAVMTRTLGQAALQLYMEITSRVLPIPPENRPTLVADLEADPFVGHALSSATCDLYHRYGMYLAPLTALLTTVKHCRFKQKNIPIIEDKYDRHNGEPREHTLGESDKESERP